MSQTLATYTAIVQNEVDDTSTSAKVVIEQDIKEVYQEVLLQAGRYLVSSATYSTTAVAGTAQYTPTEYTDILSVHYKSAGGSVFDKLSQISEDEFLTYHLNDTSSVPTHFYEKAGTINLVPAPSDAGTVRVQYIPVSAELTNVSIIPDRFTNVIKYGASYKFLAYDKDPATTDYWGFYQQALQNMILELSTKTQIIKPKIYGL
jgi:hypothetical protein